MPENPWLLTASGHRFPLLDPTPDDVRLEDIAHSLSFINRYAGHTLRPYTVAEHSILVSLILREQGHPAATQLAGLFHDAAEAYIGDMPTPVKWALEQIHPDAKGAWTDLECVIEKAIFERFAIPSVNHDTIKLADTIAMSTEVRDLMPAGVQWPTELPAPYQYNVEVALVWAQWLHLHTTEAIHTPACLFQHVYDNLVLERLMECSA